MYLVLRRDKERFARPSAMSNAYTAGELYEAYELLQFMLANDDSSSDDSSDDNDDLNDLLLMLVCDPLQRRRLQDIGPEVYSLARLQREAAERGFTADDASSKVQTDFGSSEFGRLCHPPHTTHYTQCTSTAHPAPCPQCQYSSFLVLNLVTVLRPLRACA